MEKPSILEQNPPPKLKLYQWLSHDFRTPSPQKTPQHLRCGRILCVAAQSLWKGFARHIVFFVNGIFAEKLARLRDGVGRRRYRVESISNDWKTVKKLHLCQFNWEKNWKG